jgi:hypothetical protein
MLTDHQTTDSFRLTDRFSHSSPGGAKVGGAIDPWHGLGDIKNDRHTVERSQPGTFRRLTKHLDFQHATRREIRGTQWQSDFSRLTRFRRHSRHQHTLVPLRRLGDATTTRVKSPFAGHGRNLHSRE